MALLDSLIRETAERFGVGNKASGLVGETIRFMIDPEEGGLRGFIDRFKNAGIGDLASSWVAKGGAKKPLTGPQLESAVGQSLISRIAGLLALGNANVRSVLAFLIPKLVDLLTPDGIVPETLPADVQSFLNSAKARISTVSARSWAAPLEEEASGIPWWGWLLALLWAALLAYWALRGPGEEVVARPAAVVQPRAALPARLSLSNTDGKVEYSGVVADERTRSTVIDILKKVFGEGNVVGNLNVDSRVGPAKWLTQLKVALEQFKIPGVDLLLEGDRVNVGGWLSDLDRTKLLDNLKSLFGSGFSFGLLGDKLGDAVKTASEKTLAALNALRPGYSGSDLVRALNLWVINFATDSAEIPADSLNLVARAAQAIKAAPAQTVIEISGHTDSTGDPAANQVLSQGRAEAVKSALVDAGIDASMLRAKGYGSDQPVASNDTPYGRFRNRRIEFVVVQ